LLIKAPSLLNKFNPAHTNPSTLPFRRFILIL
jgi:hypothetical protein